MDRLQPDHRSFEPDPDLEDRAYDDARQRKLDEEMDAQQRTAAELDDLLTAAVKMARVAPDDMAKDAVKFVYLQGRIDGLLSVKP